MADDLIRKSDVLETYADLYDIFDDNKAIQEELHKVFDKINNIPFVESNSSEIPNNCDTCRNKGFEGCEQPCLGCGCCGLYEPKDEPTISKMEQVDEDINVRSKDEPRTEGVWNAGYKTGYDKGFRDARKVNDSQKLVKDLVKAFGEDGTWLERQGVYTLTLAEAKQRAVDIIESVLAKDENSSEKPNNCDTCRNKGFEGCEQPCLGCGCCGLYEPKDEPTTQKETQNSNLTFEKRTMRDCYNCKRYETESECVECKYEPKDEPQMRDATAEERASVRKYIKSISKDARVNFFDELPQTKLCRECDDYAGDGMYCASNHIVYDFSTSKGNCEPQTDCYKCADFWNCDGQCDEVEDEPQTDCAWK